MKIQYKMGEMFPANDELSCWLVQLSMIVNDLILTNRYVIEKYTSDEPNQYEGMYFFRLACSHFREGINIIYGKDSICSSSKQIQSFINSLPVNALEHYNKLKSSADPWDDTSFVKNSVLPIRNSCFHYPSQKELNPILKDLAECQIEEHLGTVVADFRVRFADEICVNLAFGKDTTIEKVGSVLHNMANLISSMISFVEIALAYYLQQKPFIELE